MYYGTYSRNGSGEPARAWSPAWDTIARGSLQWLPARVMCVLPRWHTQRCGRCQNSRYFYGQRRGLPPRRGLPVRPEHDRVQSYAIALRSPASERPSDLNRYSPDMHLSYHRDGSQAHRRCPDAFLARCSACPGVPLEHASAMFRSGPPQEGSSRTYLDTVIVPTHGMVRTKPRPTSLLGR